MITEFPSSGLSPQRSDPSRSRTFPPVSRRSKSWPSLPAKSAASTFCRIIHPDCSRSDHVRRRFQLQPFVATQRSEQGADVPAGEQTQQISLQISRQTYSEPVLSDHAPPLQPLRSCWPNTPAPAVRRNAAIRAGRGQSELSPQLSQWRLLVTSLFSRADRLRVRKPEQRLYPKQPQSTAHLKLLLCRYKYD